VENFAFRWNQGLPSLVYGTRAVAAIAGPEPRNGEREEAKKTTAIRREVVFHRRNPVPTPTNLAEPDQYPLWGIAYG